MKISAKEKMPNIDKKLNGERVNFKYTHTHTHEHVRVLKFLNKFSLVNCESGSTVE